MKILTIPTSALLGLLAFTAQPGCAAEQDPETTNRISGFDVRIHLGDYHRIHPFVDGSVQILYTPGGSFPAGGTGINGFLRAGGGAAFDITSHLALEAVYDLAHISNGATGQGAWHLSPANPMWNGQGGTIALRCRL